METAAGIAFTAYQNGANLSEGNEVIYPTGTQAVWVEVWRIFAEIGLGPSDSEAATSATIPLTFSSEGEYRLCYKLDGGAYAAVGTAMLTVSPPPPPSNTTSSEIQKRVDRAKVEATVVSGVVGVAVGAAVAGEEESWCGQGRQ